MSDRPQNSEPEGTLPQGEAFARTDVTGHGKFSDHFAQWMVNSVPNMVISVDLERRITFFNHAAEKVFGYRAEEVIGQPVDILYADPAESDRVHQAALKNREFSQEVMNRRRNGDVFICHLEASTLLTNHGEVIGYCGISNDISEQKKVSQALAQTNHRLRMLAEMTSCVVGSMPLVEQSRFLASKVCHVFNVETTIIRILDGDEMVLLACAGVDENALFRRRPAYEGVGKEIILAQKPIWVSDVRRHPTTQPLTTNSPFPFVSYAGAPLMAEGQVIGIIGIFTRHQIREFTETDLEHLQIVANHVSVSIVNDGFYKEVRQQRDELEVQISERQRAEGRTARSVSLLEATLESTADGILVVDRSGRILSFNQKFVQMWRITPEIIALRNDEKTLEFVVNQFASPENFLRKVHELYDQPLAESTDMLEFKDGRWFERYSKPQIVGGEPVGRVWSFRDVTQRKRSEIRQQGFSQLGERLSAARNEDEVGRAVLEVAQKLIGWEAAYLVRYFPETQTKKSILHIDTIDGECRDATKNIGTKLSPRLEEVIRKGGQLILRKTTDEEIGFIPFGDKSKPSASILIVPVRNKESVAGVLSIQSYQFNAYVEDDLHTLQTLADLCGGTLERISAEHALLEERNLLRTLIDNLPDYIYVKDAKSRNLLDNAAHRHLLGLRPTRDVIGGTVADYCPPELAEQYLRDDQHVLTSGQPLLNKEEPALDENSQRRWLLTTKVPFRDNEGKIAGIVGISRDITEKKRLEIRTLAFSGLGQRLSAATNISEAGRVIVQVADELLGWDACYLHLCSADGSGFQTILNLDTQDDKRLEYPSNLTKPSARMFKAMQEGGVLVLRDKPPEPSAEVLPYGNTSRLSASIIVVPVRHNQNVVGVLSIQSYRKNAYDQAAVETLQGLSDHCGGALVRLKAESENRKMEHLNQVLSHLARNLNTATTQESAGQIIVETATELLSWDACTLDVFVEDKNTVHSLVLMDTIQGRKTNIQNQPDAPPSGWFTRVRENGAELVLRKPEEMGSSQAILFGDKDRLSASIMNVPIRHAERFIGMFSIQSYSFDAYRTEDLRTLQTLADHCGGALQRIRSVQALLKNEEEFRSLSESAPVGIFKATADGARTYLNQRWYQIADMNIGEGLGFGWRKVVHPDDQAMVDRAWQKAIADREDMVMEHRLLTPAGVVRWVRVMASPLFSAEGLHVGFVGNVENITERKRAEQCTEAFSKLGQRLGSAASPSQAARIISEIADDLFHWDAFTLDLYSPEDGRCFSVLNIDTVDGRRTRVPHTNGSNQPTLLAQQVMRDGAQLILKENPEQMLDTTVPFGSALPSAAIMMVPLREKARVIGVLSVQSYLSRAYDHEDLRMLQLLADHCSGALERIRAEEALRNSEVRFQSVWESSVDSMRLTDEQGTIIAVNNAYCRLVGMKREEMVGKPFTVVYADKDNPDESLRKYKTRFQKRIVQKHSERSVNFKNGKKVQIEHTNSFLESRDGKSLLLSLFRDVTAQKKLEEELRQAQKLESIGRLAGGVAHDFNNILTVIAGHASLLEMEDGLPPRAAESVHQICSSADRAANLTRQLLAFGRKQVMQPRNLDLNEVLNNLTKMLQRLLGEDVLLQVSLASNLPTVYADQTMLEQILLNLAVNARDAMPKGGALQIRTQVHRFDQAYVIKNPETFIGDYVSFQVKDTGCGIPLKNMPHIFEPFFTTKDIGKGTGLGLAMVYGIVKQHNGWITVQSEEGKGTAFEIFLPIGRGVVEMTEVSEDAPMRGGSETILLVEDEPEVRQLALNILERLGYRCLPAHSALDAFDIWEKRRDEIDLLLTDIVMPDGISGRDLAERLHREKENLKVVYTSGYAKDVAGGDFALREGFNFLQKPYHPQKLAHIIRESLDHK